MPVYFVNKPKRGRRRVAQKRKRRRRTSAKQRAAALRNLRKARAAQGRKTKRTGRRRHRRTSTVRRRRRSGGANMESKRRKRTAGRRRRRVGANPRRRRRRGYRRNPGGFSVRGIMSQVQDAAKGVAAVLVGKAAARAVPQMVGITTSGPTGIAVQALVAVGIGFAASKFLGRSIGRDVMVGAFLAPAETVVRGLNLPIISAALSGEDELFVGEYPQVAALPDGGEMGYAAYPY